MSATRDRLSGGDRQWWPSKPTNCRLPATLKTTSGAVVRWGVPLSHSFLSIRSPKAAGSPGVLAWRSWSSGLREGPPRSTHHALVDLKSDAPTVITPRFPLFAPVNSFNPCNPINSGFGRFRGPVVRPLVVPSFTPFQDTWRDCVSGRAVRLRNGAKRSAAAFV